MSTTPRTSETVAITFDGVAKSFERGNDTLRVLDDCEFDVPHGEFVSVIGPSGCGKSTLLGMAAGFAEPDTGSVVVGGSPVEGPDPSRGVVFQQYAIFPWLTVRQNIAFGLTLRAGRRSRVERDATVQHYIELMGLEGFENSYPKELSGGMRQRVAIARAYAPDPKVLLMDEPFAALDAQTREFMQELLARTQSSERRTVMFITHSVEEAIFLSHRIVVLTRRPARVREVISVPLAMPREPDVRLTEEFLELRRHLERLLRSEVDEKGNAA